MLEYYIEKLRKQTKVSKQTIKEEIKATKNIQDSVDSEDIENDDQEDEETDPEVLELANQIAQDPQAFKHRIDLVNDFGIINERRNIGIYCLTIDSSLNPKGIKGTNTLATKNTGIQGAGKSAPLEVVLEIYPKSAYHLISGGSPKSIYFMKNGLEHKALIIGEAFSFQNNNSIDSEFTYIVRTLLSEGFVRYQYTSFDSEGNKITVSKRIPGPTSLITTSIHGTLEQQLDDRMLNIHPDTSSQQTCNVLSIEAKQASGVIKTVDKNRVKAWRYFLGSLEPLEVIIPYASGIYEFLIKNGDLPITARRSFKRVLISIQSVAIMYQNQRDRDGLGRVIAKIRDYWMAFQLIDEYFRESLGLGKYTDNRIGLIEKCGPITPRDLAKLEGVSGSAISQWCEKWLDQDVLCWSDKNGQHIEGDKLNRFKRTGKAHLKIFKINRLPTPFELTGDIRWAEDGDLYKFYDLELEPSDPKEHLLSDNTEASTTLNTSKDIYDIDNKQKTGDLSGGVKLKSEISNKNEIKIISKLPKEQIKYDSMDTETKKLADEFGEILLVPDERVPTNNKPVRKTGSLPEGILLV